MLAYDNIKGHKKAGFHPLFGIYIFRKTTNVGVRPLPSAVLGLSCAR